MDTLKPNVDVIIRAAEGLMDSETLKAFLRFVLHAGNFINAVSVYARVHTHTHARETASCRCLQPRKFRKQQRKIL